ncbi:hypothetical protein [Streptomyces sp. S.PB5]|uniref:hypothetical protein n=1 Tax=Streptomyces sp. S.PB5 TaxID=3020844 RepID=UPI0025B09D15|nr:hypothetical protein [Streptomyces sp. S.PB5]MDN3028924.1 hypothetical protein [Streptomyces sp. S.PB5]
MLPVGAGDGRHERAAIVVQLAAALPPGAANLSAAEQPGLRHRSLSGPAASDSTTRRTLTALDEPAPTRMAKARRTVRQHV